MLCLTPGQVTDVLPWPALPKVLGIYSQVSTSADTVQTAPLFSPSPQHLLLLTKSTQGSASSFILVSSQQLLSEGTTRQLSPRLWYIYWWVTWQNHSSLDSYLFIMIPPKPNSKGTLLSCFESELACVFPASSLPSDRIPSPCAGCQELTL